VGIASQVDADLEGGASFSTTDMYADFTYGRMIAPGVNAGISFGYGQKNYDFSGSTELSSSDPWQDIRRYELGLSLMWLASPPWSFFVFPGISAYQEAGADFEDSLTAGLVLGSSYRFSENLSLGLGLGWAGQVEEDAEFFPFPIITWQITERLRLENGEGFAATLGPGLGLMYDLSDSWSTGLLGRWSLFRFRLDDEATAPDGVGEDSHYALYAHVDYALSPFSSVNFFAGYQFEGELKLEDRKGQTLAKEAYDDVFVAGLVAELSF